MPLDVLRQLLLLISFCVLDICSHAVSRIALPPLTTAGGTLTPKSAAVSHTFTATYQLLFRTGYVHELLATTSMRRLGDPGSTREALRIRLLLAALFIYFITTMLLGIQMQRQHSFRPQLAWHWTSGSKHRKWIHPPAVCIKGHGALPKAARAGPSVIKHHMPHTYPSPKQRGLWTTLTT
jgi:hypothetical protein